MKTMKFFVPYKATAEPVSGRSENESYLTDREVWQSFRKVCRKMGYDTTTRKIYKIAYDDKDRDFHFEAEVGKKTTFNNEKVFAILETHDLVGSMAEIYFVFTTNRGVYKDEPIFVGKHLADTLVEFDKASSEVGGFNRFE